VSAQAVRPTQNSSSESTPNSIPIFKNPPRQVYPAELLKHRFLPYGSETPDQGAVTVEAMDVDVEVVTQEKALSPELPLVPAETTKGKKKRKGDVESSPRKAKKAKLNG
jgi:hypothetical protein